MGTHFGGVHDVKIKIAEKAILTILSYPDLNDKDLTTAFIRVEAFLNLVLLQINPLTLLMLLHLHLATSSTERQQVYLHQKPQMKLLSTSQPKEKVKTGSRTYFALWKRLSKDCFPLLNALKKGTKPNLIPEVKVAVLSFSAENSSAHWPLAKVLELSQVKMDVFEG